MRTKILATVAVLAVALAATQWTPGSANVTAAVVSQMTSIGPLAFGPDGVLFAADTQSAAIYALELGKAATGGAPRRCREHDPRVPSTRRSRRCSAPTSRRSRSPTWPCIRDAATPTSP